MAGGSEEVAAAVGELLLGRIAVHLAHDLGKDLVDVHLGPGRGLDVRTVPRLRQRQTLHRGHLALVFQVHLVAHQQQRHPVRALHPRDLRSTFPSPLSPFKSSAVFVVFDWARRTSVPCCCHLRTITMASTGRRSPPLLPIAKRSPIDETPPTIKGDLGQLEPELIGFL